MSSVRIAAVINNHNYGQFVCEAVRSALAQSHPPAEVIVVDDGSTDDSLQQLQQSFGDHPLVRVIATANHGQLAAVVSGVRAASADVVALLDADDRWRPQYFERLARRYGDQPACDFVFTNMEYFGTRQGLLRSDTRERDLGYSVLLGAFNTQYQGTATSALSFRKTLAEKILASVTPALESRWPTGADDIFVVGADILGGRKTYLGEALVEYRYHTSNDSAKRGIDRQRKYFHWLRAQALIEHFRAAAGLSRETIRFAKHEFRCKPAPDWRDVQDYSALIGLSDLGWGQKLEHRFSLLRHWLRHRG
jgi:glycosyltransferase involved in cell wall biosynthesis